jgi:hypothetical protein
MFFISQRNKHGWGPRICRFNESSIHRNFSRNRREYRKCICDAIKENY